MPRLVSALSMIFRHPYNRGSRVSAALRYLEWQLRRRLGRPWKRMFWGDRLVTLYPDSSESMWLLYNVEMDWPEFPFLRRYLRSGDTMIDVGANIGAYTLWASRFLGVHGKLIAFEPDGRCFARLSEQVLQNRLTCVVLEKRAIAQTSGPLRLTTGHDMENFLVTELCGTEAVQPVDATTLDDYLGSASIEDVNFLKIDVEGAEPLVLDGANSALKSRRIATIQLEVGEHWARYGGTLSSVSERLDRYGYRPFAPSDDGRGICRIGDWNAAVRGQNLFVTRSIEEVSDRVAANARASG